MKLELALSMAHTIQGILTEHVQRIELVGSNKRQDKEDVHDIEFLIINRPERPIPDFGDPKPPATYLDKALRWMDEQGYFKFSLGDKQGPNQKTRQIQCMRFGLMGESSFPLELYITIPEKWGIMNVIRTGPAPFSHCYVTSEEYVTHDGLMGLLPACFEYHRGTYITFQGETLLLPEERDAIELLGWGWIPPKERRKYVKQKGETLPPRKLAEIYTVAAGKPIAEVEAEQLSFMDNR